MLYRVWPQALDALMFVKPATLIHWHYLGFKLFWRWRSKYKPWRKVGPELRELIWRMCRDNPTWGCHRIAGELKMLGFKVSDTTVYRYMPRRLGCPSPGWRAFILNHMKETAAVDFLVVFTVTFQLLYAMVVISHSRRRIIHFGVTEFPTQEWASDQMRQAFLRYPKPKFLVRDRDSIYGSKFRGCLKEMKIKELVTMRHSPRQNIYAERVIGSIKRECLDHVIIMNARHLRRLLDSYLHYYNYSRTHLSLGYDCPVHRQIERPSKGKKIVAVPQVTGLHHRYERRAA
jgi:transposase InsO family protein